MPLPVPPRLPLVQGLDDDDGTAPARSSSSSSNNPNNRRGEPEKSSVGVMAAVAGAVQTVKDYMRK